jgi:hypothetical protein
MSDPLTPKSPREIELDTDPLNDYTDIRVPMELKYEFTTMLRKALNCWPDASPQLKRFADIWEFGAPLQNYDSQN